LDGMGAGYWMSAGAGFVAKNAALLLL